MKFCYEGNDAERLEVLEEQLEAQMIANLALAVDAGYSTEEVLQALKKVYGRQYRGLWGDPKPVEQTT